MGNASPSSIDQLTALAEEIGAAGAAEDQANGVLAKAVSDLGLGISSALKDALGIIRMEKAGFPTVGQYDREVNAMGKGDGEDDPDTVSDDHLTEDRGGEGPEGGMDMEDDEGGAEDMELGADGVFDVTEFIQTMRRDQVTNRRLLKAVRKENKELRRLVVSVLETQVATVGPLAKAHQELLTRLSDVPEMPMALGGRLPSTRALRRHGVTPQKPKHAATGFLGGNELNERRVLAKAMAKGIIDEDTVRRFKHTRAFDQDADTSNAIREKVEAVG